MSVKTITSFPLSQPAIDGLVSLFSSETGRLLLVGEKQEQTDKIVIESRWPMQKKSLHNELLQRRFSRRK